MSTSGRPRPRSVAPAPPAVGDVIAGKYRVERAIGEGAMGIVVAAHHTLLDVPVAVKLLSPELVLRHDVVERFLLEARAVARLKSEHVARVMDVGTLETGQPFIVMELLEGEDLEKRLAEQKRLGVPDAVDCVLQALEAIAQAHAIGVVHRDLKPANLFVTVTPDGAEIVKVLDFGIAKLTEVRGIDREGKSSRALTGDHAVLGSPAYMSPEQVRDSGRVDHRTDLWSLGAILYELVAGAPAFAGESVGEVFGAILHETPTPLREWVPDAPPALQSVVDRCLERAAEKRWADAGQLARALAPLGSGDFIGYCDRIEQILSRAGQSDSDGNPPSYTRARAKVRAYRPHRLAAESAGTLLAASLRPPPRDFSAGSRALAGVALLGLGAGLVVLYATMHARGQPAVAPAASSVSAPLPAAGSLVAPPTETSEIAIVPPASTAPPGPVASGGAPATFPARAQGGRARPVPSAAKPRSNCNPNYTYDADGNKVFKPECFLH